MKILKIFDNVKMILVDPDVNIGRNKQNDLTLYVWYKESNIPLITAHGGRVILMKKTNAIEI